MNTLNIIILGNSLFKWAVVLLVVFLSITLLTLIKRILISRLAKIAERTKTKLDDDAIAVLKQTKGLFLSVISLYIGSRFLVFPDEINRIIVNIVIIALFIQAGIWIAAIFKASLERYRLQQLQVNPASATTLNALGFIGSLILWSVVVLLILDNLGVDVTALIAGLGIGGIAVALALQNILTDLFAALTIVVDKPFAIGDFLIIDDYLGSVENVGLKTTRIRSLSGEQLIFSNSDLLKSRVRNYGRMYERRVVFSIGVTYQIPLEKLKQIPLILREIVEKQQNTRFDRAHFKSYGDFSLIFETVYFVLKPDYTLHMDIQQAVNFAIRERFDEQAIEFAYPTQTLIVTSQN
jgi:small-conductance mechanosensitive channel